MSNRFRTFNRTSIVSFTRHVAAASSAHNRASVSSSFRMPGAPFTSWLTLAFLVGVPVLMAFDYPGGTWTIATIPVVVLALIVGWKLAKRGAERERAIAARPPARTVADPARNA